MRVNRNLVYYSLLTIAVFLSPTLLTAQKQPVIADKETLKMIREADGEKGKETGALILLRDYTLTVDVNNNTKMVIRVLGKLYTKEAISDYSQIPLPYNSYYEEPDLNYAMVIKADGTTREVSKDAIQIKTAPESQGQYTDSRYLSFALSGMEPGAAFDYQITFTQKEPQIEGEWFDNHFFTGLQRNLNPPYIPRIDPVVTSKYTLLVPSGSKFLIYLFSSRTEPKIETIGSQDKYQWVFNNLSSVKLEEGMPNLSSLGPTLILSSMSDWSRIDAWASEKLLSKVEVTDEMALKVKQLTTGKRNDDEKIVAISDFIQTNIRYIYADIDRGGYTPHSVNEILKSKYGDCKDQSILFVSMLKAAGIEAYPALINPVPVDQLAVIPGPWFSHLITYIPQKDREFWLDMTSEVTPFPDISFPNQGREVFIVNGKGGRLTKTPSSDARANVSVFEFKSSFKESSGYITVKIDSKGMESDVLKSVFRELDAESRTRALKELVNTYVKRAEFDGVKSSDMNNPEAPFSVEFKYHVDSIWKKGTSSFTWGSYTLLPLQILGNIGDDSPVETRKNDIVNLTPFSISGSEEYISPDRDFLPVSIPANDSTINEFFSFVQKFSRGGNGITLNWKYSFTGTTIPKEKYVSYLSAIKSLNGKIDWKITYVDPLEFVKSFGQENQYKTLAFCNQSLLQDPDNVLALLLQGVTNIRLNQDEPATKAFREALALAPDNKYAHLFMTYPQSARKNPGFVAEHLNQALYKDPDFEPALLDRSNYYKGLNYYDKAMVDIDRVIKLNPASYRGFIAKGALLSKMGKKLQSFAAFNEALKIDSTDITLCTMVAENYLRVDSCRKAIALFNKAISLDSNNARSYGSLGWAWYLANDNQKCIEYSQKALSIDPKTYFAKYNLALANLRSGNLKEARRLYRELKVDDKDVSAAEHDSAKKDLYNLKAKGNNTDQIRAILTDFF